MPEPYLEAADDRRWVLLPQRSTDWKRITAGGVTGCILFEEQRTQNQNSKGVNLVTCIHLHNNSGQTIDPLNFTLVTNQHSYTIEIGQKEKIKQCNIAQEHQLHSA